MRLRNDGTVHLKPSGSITVRNIFGEEVARVALPEWNVLPGAVRKFEATAGDGYWLGRYTAEIDATYGQDRHIIQGSVKFWVVPWKKLTFELGIAALFLLFVILARGRFRAAWHVLRTGEEEPPQAPP